MRYIDSWICITYWLLAALEMKAIPQEDDTSTPNAPVSTATAATLPDLILRTQPKSRGKRKPTTPSTETTSPYIPMRLTDPPPTKKPRKKKGTTYIPIRLTDPPPTKKPRKKKGTTYIPLRLTDPPTPSRLTDTPTSSIDPLNTTYELSVTPVVLPPRKVKSRKSIRDDCVQFGLIPDLFDDSPPHPMQVRFLFEFVPKFGNSLNPIDLVYRPYYVIWPHRKTHFYTLMLIDIDYPSRGNPFMRSYQHWLVVNIRGEDWISSDCWSEYIGPNPLYGSGLHRYVFLVFKQPKFIHFKDLRYPKMRLDEHRANFSVNDFKKRYDLKPHAINFFQAQWMCDFVYPNDRHHMIEHYPLQQSEIDKNFGDIHHF